MFFFFFCCFFCFFSKTGTFLEFWCILEKWELEENFPDNLSQSIADGFMVWQVKWKELQPLDPRKWRSLNLCSIIKNLALVQENWIKSAMKLSRKFLLYSILWICLNIFFEGLYVKASDPVGNCANQISIEIIVTTMIMIILIT